MKFYKISAKIGHHGCGKYRTMPLYVFADNVLEAIDKIRYMPAVKKSTPIPFTSAKEVDEKEFITNYIFNSYYDFFRNNKIDTQYIIPLDVISKDFKTFMFNHFFTTHEGRTLKYFCESYIRSDDITKKKINQKYIDWTMSLIPALESDNIN